jgi:hypothetical protein
MQDASASGEKKEIYFINRMFAPAFKISYRTRGGLNPITVTDEYFTSNFNPQSVLLTKKEKARKPKVENNMQLQLDFFDYSSNTLQSDEVEFDTGIALIDIDVQEDE